MDKNKIQFQQKIIIPRRRRLDVSPASSRCPSSAGTSVTSPESQNPTRSRRPERERPCANPPLLSHNWDWTHTIAPPLFFLLAAYHSRQSVPSEAVLQRISNAQSWWSRLLKISAVLATRRGRGPRGTSCCYFTASFALITERRGAVKVLVRWDHFPRGERRASLSGNSRLSAMGGLVSPRGEDNVNLKSVMSVWADSSVGVLTGEQSWKKKQNNMSTAAKTNKMKRDGMFD